MADGHKIDDTSRPRAWPDRHQPAAHFLIGCGVGGFAAVWTLAGGFIASHLWDGPPASSFQGSRASLGLHNLALFQLPFFYSAVLLWWLAAAQLRQVRLRPAGLARTRRTADGWHAEIPSAQGFLFAIGVFQLTLFLTALTPLVLLGKRNPLWVWYLAGPLAFLLGVAAYRLWHHRPTVRIDQRRRTLSLSRGRRQLPLVVPWERVETMEVVVFSFEEGQRYDFQAAVRVGDGTETVRYVGYSYPEPAERFARWLRDHITVVGALAETTRPEFEMLSSPPRL